LKSTENHLIKFAEEQKRSFDFDDINWSFREHFLNYLYKEPRKLSQNTADKYIQILKLFMKEAQKDGLHSNTIYQEDGFKVGKMAVKKVALTKAELKAFKEADLKGNERLIRTRDLFLLACYTGLRYSDFINIRKENKVEIEGFEFLNVITQKTGEEVYIPFTNDLKELLEKYDYQSPKPISSQRLNEYIKDVCEIAKINEPIIYQYSEGGKKKQETKYKYQLISSHTGRRTWATLMYMDGYPIGLLRQVTSHSTDAMFLRYVGAKKKEYAVQLAKEMKKKQGVTTKLKVV
jgi:integrase